MQDKIDAFREHVIEQAANPEFAHHKWFTKWHLEIAERIALELLQKYPEANRDLVTVMVWLHDYPKILDFDNQYTREVLNKGRDKLVELGFAEDFANKAADYVEWGDKKLEVDLHEAPIEVQILSSADGCSHLAGPFMYVVWNTENDPTFKGSTLDQLTENVRKKARKDWDRKVVLPEARAAFEARHHLVLEQTGELPEKFLA